LFSSVGREKYKAAEEEVVSSALVQANWLIAVVVFICCRCLQHKASSSALLDKMEFNVLESIEFKASLCRLNNITTAEEFPKNFHFFLIKCASSTVVLLAHNCRNSILRHIQYNVSSLQQHCSPGK
jgi:hypothetical protein